MLTLQIKINNAPDNKIFKKPLQSLRQKHNLFVKLLPTMVFTPNIVCQFQLRWGPHRFRLGLQQVKDVPTEACGREVLFENGLASPVFLHLGPILELFNSGVR
jgi:hypothetical protein